MNSLVNHKFIKADNKVISLYCKYEVSNYYFVDDQIITSSKPIDIASIVERNTILRRTSSLEKVLQSYMLSSMIKCGIEALELAGNNFGLVRYRGMDFNPFFSMSYFLSDNDTFLWSVEYTSKQVLRIHCKIQVVYD